MPRLGSPFDPGEEVVRIGLERGRKPNQRVDVGDVATAPLERLELARGHLGQGRDLIRRQSPFAPPSAQVLSEFDPEVA